LGVHRRNINDGRRLKNMLGKRLRELRESVGLSHAEMVRRLQNGGWEIDPATYTRIELGQRTLTDYEVFECLQILGKNWGDLDG
jgi:transcriptional regulator with XRE-family HTH domain